MDSLYKSGIYKITNTTNNKIYIGSSKNIKNRWKHKYNRYLEFAFKKYGKQAFTFEILLWCSEESLLFYEQRALDIYNSHDKTIGYNICPTAGSTLGRTLSKEHIEKSIATKKANGFKHSEYTKEKMRLSNGGNNHRLGHKLSEETKKKISNAHKGKKLSKETKLKLSIINTGKSPSKEAREKQSKTLKETLAKKKLLLTNTL